MNVNGFNKKLFISVHRLVNDDSKVINVLHDRGEGITFDCPTLVGYFAWKT